MPVTGSGNAQTYRYVARDGDPPGLDRQALARVRSPRLVGGLVLTGLVLGVGASLIANAASLPQFLVRVLLIGAAWGLAWVAVVVLVFVVLGLPLANRLNRRAARRLFPPGSVTEVELNGDTLVIRRPTGSRSVPYRAVRRVRTTAAYLVLEARSAPFGELLPRGMLPEEAVELIRARSRDTVSEMTVVGLGDPTRQMAVPDGWATHVATLHTAALMSGVRFWGRIALTLLLVVPLAFISGPEWLLLIPTVTGVLIAVTFVRTQRAIAAALPPGSKMSSHVRDDRLITRNVGGSREIPFDQVRSVDVRGDVVFLRLSDGPVALAIARSLIPDETLAALQRQA